MTVTIPPATGPADEPALSWCGGCGRPTGICQCVTDRPDRSTTPTATAGSCDTTEVPEPSADAVPVATGRPVDTTPGGHRSPVDTTTDSRSGTGRPKSTDQSKGCRSPEPVKLGRGGWTTVVILAILGLALGAVGFAVSFATVEKAMLPAFGDLAWLVPLGVDLGIVVFSGIGLLLAKLDMQIRWLRFVPWALTAATIYLNVTAYDQVIYQVAHAALPMLWVVVSEVVAHIVRERVGLERGTTTDSIPVMRWILAPVATAKLWRLMRLWDIRSYDTVLADERRRLLARTALSTKYGWAWRWNAPPMLRAKYRLRDLSDVDVWGWQSTDRTPTGATRTNRPAATRSDRNDPTPTGDTKPPVGSNTPSVAATGRKRPATAGADRSRATTTARVNDTNSGRPEKPASDRLAEAWAKFQTEGKIPSGQELAKAAGCSKTVANDWKRDNAA